MNETIEIDERENIPFTYVKDTAVSLNGAMSEESEDKRSDSMNESIWLILSSILIIYANEEAACFDHELTVPIWPVWTTQHPPTWPPSQHFS